MPMSDSRNGHDIELLAPERPKPRRDRQIHPVEFEDAEFETVIPCDGYGAPEGFHIPFVTPEPRQPIFRHAETPAFEAERQRLELFARRGRAVSSASAPRHRMAGPAFLAGVVVLAATAFWMAGGHRLLRATDAPDPMPTASIPAKAAPLPKVVRQTPEPPERPMPVENKAEAKPADVPGQAKMTVQEAPRPARIERAGSILMIRSGG